MKNTLVQYRGGGYDGCFWEWNFAYFDEQGKFLDVHSTGRSGLPAENQIRAAISEQIEHVYLYDLSTEAGMNEVDSEIHAGLVVSIAKFLDQELYYEMLVRCDECENDFTHDEIEQVDLQGDGGIVYSYHGKVCYECHSMNQCEGCYEYTPGENNLVYFEDTPEQEGGQFCVHGCADDYRTKMAPSCLLCEQNEFEHEITVTSGGICTECLERAGVIAGTVNLRTVQRMYQGKLHNLVIADTVPAIA